MPSLPTQRGSFHVQPLIVRTENAAMAETVDDGGKMLYLTLEKMPEVRGLGPWMGVVEGESQVDSSYPEDQKASDHAPLVPTRPSVSCEGPALISTGEVKVDSKCEPRGGTKPLFPASPRRARAEHRECSRGRARGVQSDREGGAPIPAASFRPLVCWVADRRESVCEAPEKAREDLRQGPTLPSEVIRLPASQVFPALLGAKVARYSSPPSHPVHRVPGADSICCSKSLSCSITCMVALMGTNCVWASRYLEVIAVGASVREKVSRQSHLVPPQIW